MLLEDRKIGGWGIFLVKKNVDEVTYAYENGKNVLTIRKNIY
jgi:sigma-B regulation protein RsbU (phosphoserine phosphatase)